MYRLDLGKITDEEKSLRKKYKALAVKRKKVTEFVQRQESKGKDSVAFSKTMEHPRNSKKHAKDLVTSGKISITPQGQKKQSFKRATVLERKLSQGPPLGLKKPNTEDNHMEVQATSAPRAPAAGGSRFSAEGMGNATTKGQSTTSYLRMQSYVPPTSSSAAALEWKRSIQKERYRKNKSAGGVYFDYKRRVVQYESSSSEGDD